MVNNLLDLARLEQGSQQLDVGLESPATLLQAAADAVRPRADRQLGKRAKTRARPVQVFFDNGDPHDKDQFISIWATGRSVTALARAVAGEEFSPR